MKRSARYGLSAVMLLAALVALESLSHGQAVPLAQPLDALPGKVGPWQVAAGQVLEDDVLDILQPTDYLMRRYVDPSGRWVWLYVGYWDSQRKGAQIHSPKHCLPGGGWEPLEGEVREIVVPGREEPLPVNRFLIQKDADQQMVVYWYQSQGAFVASELAAKAELVRNALFRNRTDGAIVRVTAPLHGSVEATWRYLEAYVQELVPLLDEHLPGREQEQRQASARAT